MQYEKITKKAVVILTALCCLFSVLTIVHSTEKSYSSVESVEITVPDIAEATVYVSGNGVKKSADGKYTAIPESEIVLTAVNGSAIFTSMTVNGTEYTASVVKLTVPSDGNVVVEVNTRAPYGEDKGQYFGNPYIVSGEEDILSLSRIFAGTASSSDYEKFGESAQTAESLRYGYYRLTTNLFLNDDEFFGIGSRSDLGFPFQGCFDFAGYVVTLDITRTAHIKSEFTYVSSEQLEIADYGFFAYVYGTENKPCLIKNADVQGHIAINTVYSADIAEDVSRRVNVGGIAGTLGKNVVIDNADSMVSVSAQVKTASLYLGGLFGICSSPIESWCSAEYDGLHNNVSGVTSGDGASVYVGCFAGVLQNAYVSGATVRGESAMVLANALGERSGSAVSGGFTGATIVRSSALEEIAPVRAVSVRDIKIVVDEDYSVNSVISNSDDPYDYAINPEKSPVSATAGGIFGTVYRSGEINDENVTIKISGIRFVRANNTRGDDRLSICAQTLDGSSIGCVFAGGAVGYVESDGIKYIHHEFTSDNLVEGGEEYIFDCPVDIKAVQNGIGPAFAGGVFGFNSFGLKKDSSNNVHFKITSQGCDYSVTAIQSTSSKLVRNGTGSIVPFAVSAGGYSAYLQPGYVAENVEFSVGNGRIRAYREVGSTSIGDVAAGAYAGMAVSYYGVVNNTRGYNGTVSGSIKDLTINYSDNSFIEASCYSFDSIDDRGKAYGGSNVYAGGAIGCLIGYESFENVTVKYDSSHPSVGEESEYFVYGVQNGSFPVGHNTDLKCEGYVGGVVGLSMDTPIKQIYVKGDSENKSTVYFESANNPDTASIGGLIGASWRWKKSYLEAVVGGGSENMHVAGKAYSNVSSDSVIPDIYVGGAIGVLANPSDTGVNGTVYIGKISVSDNVIESIGEDQMLTYAGGIVAGIWWNQTSVVDSCVVKNTSVTTSSVSAKTYAGGISGLVQGGEIKNCAVLSTDVRSTSVYNEASAAGIFAWTKNYWKIDNNVSNATLYASGVMATGKDGSWLGGIGHPQSGRFNSNTVSMKNGFFVTENAGTDLVYRNTSSFDSSLYSGVGLHLVSYGENSLTLSSVGDRSQVYPGITSDNTMITISSSNSSVASVESTSSGCYVVGNSEGICYIKATATVNGEEYLLCSYPVTVVKAESESDFSLTLKDGDGNEITSDNSDAYASISDGNGDYKYFRHEVGNAKTADSLLICSTGLENFPSKVKIYDLSQVLESVDYTTPENRINEALANKPQRVSQLSNFNGKATIAFDGELGSQSKCVVSTKETLGENTIILIEYDYNGKTHGVIAEFVPNELVGISISPTDGTPPLDSYVDSNGFVHYIYSKGDTVRFNEKLIYKYPAAKSYVVATSYSGDVVATNGMVVLTEDKTYTVKCTSLDGSVSTTVYLEAREEVPFEFNLIGANVSSERKLIVGSPFEFSASPQPGYGLLPVITLTIGDETSAGVWNGADLTVTFGGNTYTVSGDTTDDLGYAVDLVLGADLTSYAEGKAVTISVEYRKIYTIVFVSNYGNNDVFKQVVPAGIKYSEITLDGFDSYVESITSARYGYDLKGFYPVEKAANLSAYGKSFAERADSDVNVISGTVRFYARWTYGVIVERPAVIDVSSTFAAGKLDDGLLVPIDTYDGFGFVMNAESSFGGTPRFNAFIRLQSGEYVNVTELFEKGAQKNSYVISSENVDKYGSGLIFISVFSDSLKFGVGDELIYDGNGLYTDGIFTVEYNVAYGDNDEGKDVSFDFGVSLPKGTSLRLYYAKDGKTVWAGGKVLDSASESVGINEFSSIKSGDCDISEYRTSPSSEKFVLVVTLPNNTNGFGITEKLSTSVSLKRYAFEKTVERFGNFAKEITDCPPEENYRLVEGFDLYPATLRTFTESENSIEYTVVDNSVTSVADRRHDGTIYVWKITVTGGGVIGDIEFPYLQDFIVRTTTAIYFKAESGQVLDMTDFVGYTLKLVEVHNAQQPAEGEALFEKVA